MASPRFRSLFFGILFGILAAVLAVSAVPAQTSSLEARAQRLETMLMAPCCGANTVATHHSGPADEARREIRRLLAGGASDRAVLDAFVERYGSEILAAPPAEGFNLVAYLGPFLALGIGLIAMALALRSWARRNRERASPLATAAGSAALPPEYARRLQDELDRLD